MHDSGEKAAEIPWGSPATEKLMERFLRAPKVALIVVLTDDPGATVTRPELESDRPAVCSDVDVVIRVVSEEDKVEVLTESRLETGAIACR